MKQKQYIGCWYLILYKDILNTASNKRIDLGTLKLVIGSRRIKKQDCPLIIHDLIRFGIIKPFNGKSSENIEVCLIPEAKLIGNPSRLYRYVRRY